jgi:hypothetical protein
MSSMAGSPGTELRPGLDYNLMLGAETGAPGVDPGPAAPLGRRNSLRAGLPMTVMEGLMKYALLLYAMPDSDERPEPRAGAGVIDSWLDYTVALRQAGVLLGAEQLDRPYTATSVCLQNGERLLTDGPFMETKEHIGGFYLIDVPDLDTALDWAAKMPLMRYGTVEVRPVMEGQEWQAGLT